MRCILFCAAVLIIAGPVQAAGKPADVKDRTVDGKNLKEWIADIKKSSDASVVVKAIQVVSRYGEAAQEDAGPRLIQLLDHGDLSVRTNAARAIHAVGLASKDVQKGLAALRRHVRDDQEVMRYDVTQALAKLGQDAQPAIPALTNVLTTDSSWEVRKGAAHALGMVGKAKDKEPNARAVQYLIHAMEDKTAQVRLEAEISLIRLGAPTAPDLRQRLARAMYRHQTDKDKVVAIWAHVGLMMTRLDKDSNHVLAIAKALKDKDPNVRYHAVYAVGLIGRSWPETIGPQVPDLIEVLRDRDATVSTEVIKSLVNLQTKKVLTGMHLNTIAVMLNDKEAHVRGHAAAALGQLGADGARHAKKLVKLLKDKDTDVVISAIVALASLGKSAIDDSVPALTELKKTTKDEKVRAAAVTALAILDNTEAKPKNEATERNP